MPAAARLPEVLDRAVPSGVERARAAGPRNPPGSGPPGPGRHPGRSHRPSTSRSDRKTDRRRRSRRGRRRRTGRAPGRRSDGGSSGEGYGRAARAAVGGACPSATRATVPARRCVPAPGTGVPGWCAGAPDHRPRPAGRRVPLPRVGSPAVAFCLRRPAIAPGTQPGVSVTDQEPDARPRRFGRGIPDPGHEPSNRIFRPSGPDGRRDGRTDHSGAQQSIDRPPVSGGDLAFPRSLQAVRPGRTGVG